MTTKGTDNRFRSLTVVGESGTPSTPGTGDFKLYVADDGTFYLMDDTGTPTAVGGGGFSDPMTTRGDIIIRNASNTTARLGRGSAGTVLTSDGTDVSWQSPSGGASDLVQTYPSAGSVYVPGLRGSADVRPSSPNAADDEFETLSGWTTLGSLTTSNVSDWPSHWHVSKANAGLQLHGIYKSAPSSPFTITCKLAECALDNGNYTNYGIIIGDSTPTKWYSFTVGVFQDNFASETWTNSTTRASSSNAISNASNKCRYLRLLVTSSTSVTGSFSRDGRLWTPAFSAVNPGTFTAANFGLAVQANGVTAEAYFDWIRVS